MTDLHNLRTRVQDLRANEPFMERILATVGITALVFLSITLLRLSGGYVFAAPQPVPPPPSPEAAVAAIFSPEKLASMVTACMNGHQFVWQDPHTGADYAAFCNVELLGRVP
jgi:hypothetical protein